MTETLIDLIRHGEPVGGRAYRGHNIDDPLSDKGWRQMWDAVGDYAAWDIIVTSPLQRCRAFTEAVAERHGQAIEIEDRFKEVGFGNWEGHTPEQLRQHNAAEYAAFYADPVNHRPPGAEPLDTFISRVSLAYDEVVERHTGKHVLIVAHAGVIRAVIAHVLHAEPIGLYRISVAHAGITRIRHGRRGAMLELHNGCLG